MLRSSRILVLRGAFIAMVQATESRMRNNAASSSRAKSASESLLPQPQMRTIFLIIAKCSRAEVLSALVFGGDDDAAIQNNISRPRASILDGGNALAVPAPTA